ncbi:hypothetical protein PBCV1_a660R [Paramecium bursaria Chlorella virus 1]|uniref:Uncharacterized protein n=1 Tax=Paramecium bursaria Chlorella virus 1 TaxID=10506 RepID=O41142_PBCV1|nr:hypothetical protein PBCV1_a660R [Paramecium bursaria Chlorella virus 1]AAC97041.1 hypothetical protein [Paramecium bursaria Chlorella virus 1]
MQHLQRMSYQHTDRFHRLQSFRYHHIQPPQENPHDRLQQHRFHPGSTKLVGHCLRVRRIRHQNSNHLACDTFLFRYQGGHPRHQHRMLSTLLSHNRTCFLSSCQERRTLL